MLAEVQFVNGPGAVDFDSNGPGSSVETWRGDLDMDWRPETAWIVNPTKNGRKVIGASGMTIPKSQIVRVTPC